MSTPHPRATEHSQVPALGALNLDHVASFVPERESCHHALEALGSSPAPFSLQYHRLTPQSDLVPAGSGNHCVMLQAGYLEYLVPTADTPVAAQLRGAIDRYVGAHSIVFGTGDAESDHTRLAKAGFDPLPPVALQREVDTSQGSETARFTVVRVPPAAMAEGRIQFCQHHTQQFVWQGRWLTHANRAVGLTGVYACVEEPAAAAGRYGRFTGVAPVKIDADAWQLPLERGRVEFLSAAALRRRFGIDPPCLPWIAGCEIRTDSLAEARIGWARHGVDWRSLSDEAALVIAPVAMGGMFLFVDD